MQQEKYNIYIAKVTAIDDTNGGDRIKVDINDISGSLNGNNNWCFPLLPKFLHVKPKIGEAVLIFCSTDNTYSQRYYIGPLISQEQYLFYDNFIKGGTNLLDNGDKSAAKKPMSNYTEANGSFAEKDDIAIYSRQNSDIILSNNDLRIRCGSRLINKDNSQKTVFNKVNPSYIKLKYHSTPLTNEGSKSSATIVADEINLIPNDGDISREEFKLTDTKEQITDDEMKKIIQNAHNLPYGDVLVDFLQLFLQMFKSHTHRYHLLPPVNDADAQKLYMKYGEGRIGKSMDDSSMKKISATVRAEDTTETFKGLAGYLLSKHVRIN